MGPSIRRFSDAATFLEHVRPLLMRREAENNLMLGIVRMLIDQPGRYTEKPYLASFDYGGAAIACAIRTPPFPVALTRMPQEVLEIVVQDLKTVYDDLPTMLAPDATAQAFAEMWAHRTGAKAHLQRGQRIYQLDEVTLSQRHPAGELRQANVDDFDTVSGFLEAFSREVHDVAYRDPRDIATRCIHDGAAFLWEDQRPVSMALWTGRTPNGIRISGVYTAPEWRGRGYASACVAHLSQRMLDEGRSFCFLFTDLDNPTSNNIYQQIGYRAVCDMPLYEFRSGDSPPKPRVSWLDYSGPSA